MLGHGNSFLTTAEISYDIIEMEAHNKELLSGSARSLLANRYINFGGSSDNTICTTGRSGS